MRVAGGGHARGRRGSPRCARGPRGRARQAVTHARGDARRERAPRVVALGGERRGAAGVARELGLAATLVVAARDEVARRARARRARCGGPRRRGRGASCRPGQRAFARRQRSVSSGRERAPCLPKPLRKPPSSSKTLRRTNMLAAIRLRTGAGRRRQARVGAADRPVELGGEPARRAVLPRRARSCRPRPSRAHRRTPRAPARSSRARHAHRRRGTRAPRRCGRRDPGVARFARSPRRRSFSITSAPRQRAHGRASSSAGLWSIATTTSGGGDGLREHRPRRPRSSSARRSLVERADHDRLSRAGRGATRDPLRLARRSRSRRGARRRSARMCARSSRAAGAPAPLGRALERALLVLLDRPDRPARVRPPRPCRRVCRCVTMLPAPITTSDPIGTPGRTIARVPMKTLSPTLDRVVDVQSRVAPAQHPHPAVVLTKHDPGGDRHVRCRG